MEELQNILALCKLSSADELSVKNEYSCSIDIEYTDVDAKIQPPSEHIQVLPFQKSAVNSVQIKTARFLVDGNNEQSKNVVELTFDITDCKVEFSPGDTIGIISQNSDGDVQSLIELLGLENVADRIYNLSAAKSTTKVKKFKIPDYIPKSSTIRKVLTDCVSLNCPPKKVFYRMLANYSSSREDIQVLMAICDKNSIVFNDIVKCNISLPELLRFCKTCRPPINALLEYLPRLLPRPYSIANSPLMCANEIKIVFSILNLKPGQTTGKLQKLARIFEENRQLDLRVDLYFRQTNSFRYTNEEFTKDIIMIGVGTAVAPFIGFLQHKSQLVVQNQDKSRVPGRALLVTGHRHKKSAIFSEEIEQFLEFGIVDRVLRCFSRESDRYRYVQDALLDNANEVVNMLTSDNCILYVCADGAEISKNIQNALEQCISSILNTENTQQIILEYKSNLKYREDIWT